MNLFLVWALGTGLVAGIIAGLMGVGGGIVIVPVLLFLFLHEGISPAIAMQMAVGTSLATIVVTNILAARGHHIRQSVRWDLARRFYPGIVAGAWLGAVIAAQIPGETLRHLFGVFEMAAGIKMVLDHRPRAAPTPPRSLPWSAFLALGVGVGCISSLFGIGGGTLLVPILVLLVGIPIHQAVGTSAAIGLAIAAMGTAGFIHAGWNHPQLPPGALGFLLPEAFFGIVAGTILTTWLGVRLAHTIPSDRLGRGFGLFLIVVGLKLLGVI